MKSEIIAINVSDHSYTLQYIDVTWGFTIH
jgi:hypothetical protein